MPNYDLPRQEPEEGTKPTTDAQGQTVPTTPKEPPEPPKAEPPKTAPAIAVPLTPPAALAAPQTPTSANLFDERVATLENSELRRQLGTLTQTIQNLAENQRLIQQNLGRLTTDLQKIDFTWSQVRGRREKLLRYSYWESEL